MAVSPLDYALAHLAVTDELLQVVDDGLASVQATESLRSECGARIGTAIDTYFHVRVRKAIFEGGLSNAARNVTVPLGAVDDMIEHVVANRDKNTRPRARLVRAVRDQLRRETFQGAKGVERAASLIPIDKVWTSVAAEMGDGSTPAVVRDRIRALYQQRNIVVHEGGFDIGVALKPRQMMHYRLDRDVVLEEVVWARQFLQAVDRL